MRGVVACVIAVAVACKAPDAGPSATIELTRGATLSGSGDTIDFIGASTLAVASNGAFVAAPVAGTSGSVAIFDSGGHFVHVLGRSGQGPGELSAFRGMPTIGGLGFGRGDSLFVGDVMAMRVLVFSPPPEVHFVRSFIAPRTLSTFAVTPSGLISRPFLRGGSSPNGKKPRNETQAAWVGMPPQIFSWDGAQTGSFGSPISDASPDDVLGIIWPADSTHLWNAKDRRYEIDLVARGGKSVRHIVRQVPWFPPDTSPRSFPWLKPPPPRIAALSVGANGALWVLIARANRNWAKHRPMSAPVLKPGMPMSMFPSYRVDELFECVIEVLDPVSGALIASTEVGGDMRGFIAPGVLYQQVEDSTGAITLQVWNAALKRRP